MDRITKKDVLDLQLYSYKEQGHQPHTTEVEKSDV